MLELLFDRFGTPEWVMKTMLVLMAVGLVFTLVFAWAFELTPEGIRRVNPDASIRTDTVKKLDRTIIIVLVLAVGYFTWESRLAEKVGKGSGPITSESSALTNDSARVIASCPRPGGALPARGDRRRRRSRHTGARCRYRVSGGCRRPH